MPDLPKEPLAPSPQDPETSAAGKPGVPDIQDAAFVMAPDGTLINVNAFFAATFRQPPDSFVGLSVYDLLASAGMPEVAEQRKAMTAAAVESGKQQVFYDEQMGRIWRHTIYPIFSGTGISHLVVIAQDVTEIKKAEAAHKQMEERIQQSHKLELLGQLAGGIAHDFNNVLAAIQVNTEMAMHDIGPEANAFALLENIRRSVDRSAQMVKQLLGFARKQFWAPKMLVVDDELAKIRFMLNSLIRENIELRWSLSSENSSVYTDPSNLYQILTNLCVNSRDAIEGYGVITVKTDVVSSDVCGDLATTSMNAQGEFVMISVTDTGKGIDELAYPHIFEPFFTTKEIGKGTGLGLATVYGLVKKNHGYVTCHSKVGTGTTFNIYLPVSRSSENYYRSPEVPITVRQLEKHTVLVVEDEPEVLSIIRYMLEKQGLEVLVAADAESALGIFEGHADPISLVITDVILPKMNGVKMAEAISRRNPSTRFIFMSGYSSQSKRSYGVFKGDSNFISKPFSINAFMELIDRCLG